ncbi:MAG: tyrosine-protein phosphatase [Rhabdochlamydiaceae bacterium]|jgi:protein tyrosine phosphatase
MKITNLTSQHLYSFYEKSVAPNLKWLLPTIALAAAACYALWKWSVQPPAPPPSNPPNTKTGIAALTPEELGQLTIGEILTKGQDQLILLQERKSEVAQVPFSRRGGIEINSIPFSQMNGISSLLLARHLSKMNIEVLKLFTKEQLDGLDFSKLNNEAQFKFILTEERIKSMKGRILGECIPRLAKWLPGTIGLLTDEQLQSLDFGPGSLQYSGSVLEVLRSEDFIRRLLPDQILDALVSNLFKPYSVSSITQGQVHAFDFNVEKHVRDIKMLAGSSTSHVGHLFKLMTLEQIVSALNQKVFNKTTLGQITDEKLLMLETALIADGELRAALEQRKSVLVTPEKRTELKAVQAAAILRELDEADKKLASDLSTFNAKKDRYKDVLQPKKTMVPLRFDDTVIDYNGALFACPKGRVYILMQGPLESTLSATKSMMAQNNVQQIVCLTRAEENDAEKCYPYWTDWDHDRKGEFTIKIPDAKEGWTPAQMFHYEEWPDHGVPKDIDQFLRFVKFQRENKKSGAMAVHCSAGVGRTGVFMVTALMMDQVEAGERILNPLQLIKQIRRVRPGMVQNIEQLQFCFDTAHCLLLK